MQIMTHFTLSVGTEQILDFVFKLLIDITKYNIICWSGSEFEFVIVILDLNTRVIEI